MNKRIACYLFVVLLLLSPMLAVTAVAQDTSATINTINEQHYSVDRAAIYIDGVFYQNTDMAGHLVLDSYTPGNHTILAVRDGFVNASTNASLEPGVTINLLLVHNYAIGSKDSVSFIVEENTVAFSKVAGAEVYVDDSLIGTTNTANGKLIAQVPAGTHKITIKKQGSDLLDNSTTMDLQPGNSYIFLMDVSGKKFSILDPDLFVLSLQKILTFGLVNTIALSLVAFAVGSIIGLIMGIGRTSTNFVFRLLSSIYVEGIRGLPLLLQLLFVNFGLPFLMTQLLGTSFNIDIFTACVIALSMNSGAYMGEIFKAGIEAVHKGQTEAARSLGMTQNQAMRFIILPQAFKIVLPALGNEFIALIKDSSIGLVISLPEIVYWANAMGARYYNAFTPILAAGLVYLMITIPLGRAVQYIEKKYNVNARSGNLPAKKKKETIPQEVTV